MQHWAKPLFCAFILLLWPFLVLSGVAAASELPSWVSETPSAREEAQAARLAGTGYAKTPKLYIRIFKASKELEVWIASPGGYKLYRSYDICRFSGELGPKLQEGDKQSPEGFYHIPAEDIGWRSKKWPRALNLSFPNIYDALKERTGSYLLIHGGCLSRGCFAMENGPMDELFALVSLAARRGQTMFPVHIFPFRLTAERWRDHEENIWAPFWRKLQPVYDHFNAKRRLPSILVCEGGYKVMTFLPSGENERVVSGNCVLPVPLKGETEAEHKKLAWVKDLAGRYEKLAGRPRQRPTEGLKIKVRCNLRLASCKHWLARRKEMLRRGTLPKSLLKP